MQGRHTGRRTLNVWTALSAIIRSGRWFRCIIAEIVGKASVMIVRTAGSLFHGEGGILLLEYVINAPREVDGRFRNKYVGLSAVRMLLVIWVVGVNKFLIACCWLGFVWLKPCFVGFLDVVVAVLYINKMHFVAYNMLKFLFFFWDVLAFYFSLIQLCIWLTSAVAIVWYNKWTSFKSEDFLQFCMLMSIWQMQWERIENFSLVLCDKWTSFWRVNFLAVFFLYCNWQIQ